MLQLYIDFVSLSSNCECDWVHVLGKSAYNACYLYVSQITRTQIQTAHSNGTEAHWDKYTSLSFPKAPIQVTLFSSWTCPSGKFAKNYQVLIARRARIRWSCKNCSLTPMSKKKIVSSIFFFLTLYSIPGWVLFKKKKKTLHLGGWNWVG